MAQQMERIARWLHLLAGASLVAIAFMTAANILGRRFFSSPISGSIELTEMGMVIVVFLGFAFAELRDDHITIDLLYERLSPRGQLILEIFGQVIALILFVVIARYVYTYAGRLTDSGQRTGILGLPIAPFAYVAIVGLIAFVGAIFTKIVLLFAVPQEDDRR